jgi:hypothetical protein
VKRSVEAPQRARAGRTVVVDEAVKAGILVRVQGVVPFGDDLFRVDEDL